MPRYQRKPAEKQRQESIPARERTDSLAGQEQELVKMVNHLEETSTAYMLMTNNTNGINNDITINNKKLETIHSLKYLEEL